ncbi:hypothetical protein TPL01_07800 [Sulfuriferula plumbiphila]|uniref:Uncharacterized protein n=1 Tax=Sulfuriferula plumbiphila TaxID=171865 RepID=A0A512L5B7_9PROT|nr:hypothetical protein [Sulfuriferula plumbiphila]BBP05872.1 hypothetical protein SFPGR_32940 [Sulfuriferula plumbiphila]GEP29642.1 hypothetical protein TPL01_07800 [Sulfuriferula plumbiphila]
MITRKTRSAAGRHKIKASVDWQNPQDRTTGNVLAYRASRHGTLDLSKIPGDLELGTQVIASDKDYQLVNGYNTPGLNAFCRRGVQSTLIRIREIAVSLPLKHRLWILAVLAAVMAATRMSDFGTSALLPDAGVFRPDSHLRVVVGCGALADASWVWWRTRWPLSNIFRRIWAALRCIWCLPGWFSASCITAAPLQTDRESVRS